MRKIFGVMLILTVLLSMVPTGNVNAQTGSVFGFTDMFPVEEVSGYLVPDHMQVMVFPFTREFFYSYFADYKRIEPSVVRTYELSGVELGYKNLYLAPGPTSGKYVRYTVFHHTTGSKLVAIGVYDEGYLDRAGNYVPEKKYYSNDVRLDFGEIIPEHSVWGDFYPNKIINDLEVAQAILDYQAKNGPFVAGQEYSFLEILNFKGRKGYVLGKTSSGSLVTGGGACVMATDWMKLLVLSGAEIVEKWGHYGNTKYFENPVSAIELPIEATDATVEWPNYDLRWIQKETSWVAVSATVMPDGDELENEYGEELILYDATEVISLRMTAEKPELSTDKLETLQAAYTQYRLGKAGMVALDGNGSRLVSRTPWAYGGSLSQLLSGIVPQERVSRFGDELKTDPFLKSLAELRYYADLVDPASNIMMGDYLKETPWYSYELARLEGNTQQLKKLDQALRHLDNYSNAFPGQKIQCYALGILVWGMDDRFVNIGGVKVTNAADLVPDSIRNGERTSLAANGMVIKTIKSLDEVKVGDLGVRYDTKAGHVFAVVGKKSVGGETVLLIASANQNSDGRIYLFEVDEGNFDAIFGSTGFKKVVLRLGTN